MNRPHNISNSRIWMMTWLLAALVAGCGERTETVTASSPATVAASANSVLAVRAQGPAPVLLGTAGNYAILAKSAISTAGGSTVTGNLGVSSAIASHRGGLTLFVSPLQFSTSPQVYGRIFASDYVVQAPAKLAAAFFEMQTAYADAAARKPDFTELGSGIIGGMTLAPGTYEWSTAVLIPTSITLSGGPDDVWIFKVAQGLVQASDARVILIGGARAKNIFWQVAGGVEVSSAAHTEGVILSQSSITLGTGASANGRLLAQTTVSLDANAVTQATP